MINTRTRSVAYADAPGWLRTWEDTGLIAWRDRNDDGVIQYAPGKAFAGKPVHATGPTAEMELRGRHGQRMLLNDDAPGDNELYIDKRHHGAGQSEIAGLPAWVVALVAAGGLAAALSTAAGLLLVISSSISHDLFKSIFTPGMSERRELILARISAGAAVLVAGYFGVNPPGFVAQVVAYAFGLAASSFFPILVLGVFSKRASREGAIAGMLTGILFTGAYIVYFRTVRPEAGASEWLFGISPEGIGTLGMLLNFAVTLVVSRLTPPPPAEVQQLIEDIRLPHKS